MSSVSAIEISIRVACACMLIGLPVATFFGWLLARRNFPGKTFLNMFLFLPLVLPPVVTGYLLLDFFGRATPLGGLLEKLGLPLSFTFSGAVLAAFVVGMPLYVIIIRAAFEAVDPRWDELSWTLGVTPRRTFFRLTLPLALPGIAAGAVMVFARALGEFGATAVLAGNMEGRTRTISLAVYSLLETPDGMRSGRTLVLASVGLSLLALFSYEYLLRWHRRRLEWREEGWR